MYRPGGYAIITGPAGVVEMDTFTCGHHGGVVHVPAGLAATVALEAVSSVCFMCRQRICHACEKERQLTARCVTAEQRIEAMERVVEGDRNRQALFKAAGIT